MKINSELHCCACNRDKGRALTIFLFKSNLVSDKNSKWTEYISQNVNTLTKCNNGAHTQNLAFNNK